MKSIFGHCDVCEKQAWLGRATVVGIETYACAECFGLDPQEFDPEPEPCEFCGEETGT